MAVPANRPKPASERPKSPPSVGKIRAAKILNKKMTEIDWAISSSSAPITGAVAAMADPPHIEEPTPMSTALFLGSFKALYITKATTSEIVIVERMMGRDCAPLDKISVRFIPNPSRTTAYCRTFLEVKAMPPPAQSLFFNRSVTTIPASMAKTGPPITGSNRPNSHAGTAIARQSSMPGPFFFTNPMLIFLSTLAGPRLHLPFFSDHGSHYSTRLE